MNPMLSRTFMAGLGLSDISDNTEINLRQAMEDGYDFITTDLSISLSTNISRRMDITSLKSEWWGTSIIGEIGHVSSINKASFEERNLYEMVDWACHMNIPVIVFPTIPIDYIDSIQYARAISSLAAKCSASNIQIWVRVPFHSHYLEAFQLLHRHCDDMSNIGCLLILNNNNGNYSSYCTYTAECIQVINFSLLHRFVGSNTRAISIHTSLFLTNKRGYPTLPKNLQNTFLYILQRIGRSVRIIIEGTSKHHCCSSSVENLLARGKSGYLSYLQYLRYLRRYDRVTQMLDTAESILEDNYLDQIQNPLQPLGNHLEFHIYENFETDTLKYSLYRSAIELAIRDGIRLQNFHENRINNELEVVILVLGAGRGPLIKMIIEAISKFNHSQSEENTGNENEYTCNFIATWIHPIIVAFEKNPSAVKYLQSLRSSELSWQDIVEIVPCDMRFAKSYYHKHPVLSRMLKTDRYKADIVVSELLGSFGDNELSPECLNGVQCCSLMKDSCVSIPQKYTSFLTPVSSMTLHSHARSQAYNPYRSIEGPAGKLCGILQAMETPYVVRPHSASQIHKEMPCWEFNHPFIEYKANHSNLANRLKNINSLSSSFVENTKLMDNERHVQITFSPDNTHGMKFGCGYGPAETNLENITNSVSQDELRKIALCGNTIHGFLGTFYCILYQSNMNKNSKVVISTAPSTFSKGIFSWFPLYFPLKEPLQVPAGASICCNMWRKNTKDFESSSGRVWYEWCAYAFHDKNSFFSVISSSSIHNPYGRSSHIRL